MSKYRVLTNGKYFKPQVKYRFWPFWFDLSGGQRSREGAEETVDWHRGWAAPYREIWSSHLGGIVPEQAACPECKQWKDKFEATHQALRVQREMISGLEDECNTLSKKLCCVRMVGE